MPGGLAGRASVPAIDDYGAAAMTTEQAGWVFAMLAVSAAVAGASFAVEQKASQEPSAALLRMHDDFVSAFVQSEGFGYARVTPMMRLMQRYRTQGAPSLQMMNLELVGIAKHDPPVVFAAPFQGFLHAADTPSGGEIVVHPRGEGRPLTQDEQDAVLALEKGALLLTLTDGDERRVTGPIRARDECLACHKNKRTGDLLGAFVYTLAPLPMDAR